MLKVVIFLFFVYVVVQTVIWWSREIKKCKKEKENVHDQRELDTGE